MSLDGFPNVAHSQGIDLSWGTTVIRVTSFSYSRSAQNEVDVTGMSSPAYIDPNNTNNKRSVKEVEYGLIDPGEVQCEFVGPSTFNLSSIGCKAPMSITGLSNAPSQQAYLTNISIQAKAGELVTGSCTFRLTGI
jgi:hypothetical protein